MSHTKLNVNSSPAVKVENSNVILFLSEMNTSSVFILWICFIKITFNQ